MTALRPEFSPSAARSRVPTRGAAAFTAGALFVAGWAVGEGAYEIRRHDDLSLWLGLIGVAGTAPLWPLAGLVALAVHQAWRKILGVDRPVTEVSARLREWLATENAATAIGRTAWTLAVLVGLVLWFAASILLGSRFAAVIRTPAFVVTSILVLTCALATVIIMTLPVLVVPLDGVLRALARLKPKVRRWMTPTVVLATAGVLALLGLTITWILYRQVMVHLPWGMAVGAACGVALAWAAVRLNVGSARPRPAAVTLIVVTALCWWAGRSPHAPRSTFMKTSGLISVSHHLFPASLAIGSDEGQEADDGRYTEGRLIYPLPAGLHRRPHILLVTTDSLSFGHTTLGGYRRNTTPQLAAWATRATVFPTAFSLSAATRTAFPGLLAGIFNAQASLKPARTPPHPYAEDMRTMATLLRDLGYRTVHIPGDRFFLQGGRGWHTVGFDVVDDVSTRAKDPIHTAPDITDAAISYMEHQPADQPLFLWVHYFDHHIPFRLTPNLEPFDEGREKVDLYDAELRFADQNWGRLLAHAERAWSGWQYLTVFTADHGESFDANHPEKHHSGSIYTSVLHVPLVIQAAQGRGETIEGLVSHADILPTIANIVGIDPVDDWVGSSLAGVLFAGAKVERTAQYSLRFAPEARTSTGGTYADIGVRTARHYLIYDLVQGTTKLVDWRRDPLERTDLSALFPDEHARLRGMARRKLAWIKARECGLRYPACP